MILHRTLALGAFALALATAPAAFAQMPPLKVVTDPKAAPAGDYKLDPHHASATLKLAHMGLSRFTMRFDDLKGAYKYDPAHPAATKVEITIDPKSIDTGDQAFNKEIAEQFLDADKYPTITFTSTKLIVGKGDEGKLEGVLDFHGVKKPLTLDVTYRGYVEMMKKQRMGFSGSTVVKRSEFGANKYVPLVGDDVTVLIEVEFEKQ